MANHDHLNPIEPAARLYCGMLGIDPDQQMAADHDLLAGVVNARPQWHFAAEKLLDLMQMLNALKAAHSAQQSPTEH